VTRPPIFRRHFGAVALVTLAALGLMAAGSFLLGSYIQNVLIRAFLFSIAALTVGVLWGYTGILSFSQGTFFGIGAYAAALTFTHLGFTTGLAVSAFLGAMVIAAVVAALVGWLAFWYGATPFYVGVVTLVLPIVGMQLIYSGGSFTGASSGLVGFKGPALSMSAWFWVSGSLLIGVAAATAVFLRSDYGTLLKAIRDNEERCRYLGINTSRVKIVLLMAMAAVSSVAGYIYACVSNLAAPEHVGFVFGTQLVINVALGGRESILGPVIGTIGLEWISAYLSGVLPFVWKLVIGAVFVLVIVVLPQGLLPPLWRLLARLSSKALRRTDAIPDVAVTQQPSPDLDGPKSASDRPALELSGVTRHFGHLKVLEGIDLQIMPGEVVGIVGPNGAGKTTLMSCISDGLQRSSGSIRVNGRGIGRRSPAEIVAFGLARSFQKTSVYDSLTVAECLRLARHRQSAPSRTKKATEIALPEAALEVLASTNLAGSPGKTVRDLPHGMKRALELVMVLSLEPSILLLDEPTAGLTKADRKLVGKILVDLHNKRGLTIVLIEHDFDFVRQVCSRLVVLHRGRLLLDGTVEEVVSSPIVQDIYSGHAQ
jgi:branched-chain amino acid transport system permease protein